jgi:hypothetical protein
MSVTYILSHEDAIAVLVPMTVMVVMVVMRAAAASVIMNCALLDNCIRDIEITSSW